MQVRLPAFFVPVHVTLVTARTRTVTQECPSRLNHVVSAWGPYVTVSILPTLPMRSARKGIKTVQPRCIKFASLFPLNACSSSYVQISLQAGIKISNPARCVDSCCPLLLCCSGKRDQPCVKTGCPTRRYEVPILR